MLISKQLNSLFKVVVIMLILTILIFHSVTIYEIARVYQKENDMEHLHLAADQLMGYTNGTIEFYSGLEGAYNNFYDTAFNKRQEMIKEAMQYLHNDLGYGLQEITKFMNDNVYDGMEIRIYTPEVFGSITQTDPDEIRHEYGDLKVLSMDEQLKGDFFINAYNSYKQGNMDQFFGDPNAQKIAVEYIEDMDVLLYVSTSYKEEIEDKTQLVGNFIKDMNDTFVSHDFDVYVINDVGELIYDSTGKGDLRERVDVNTGHNLLTSFYDFGTGEMAYSYRSEGETINMSAFIMPSTADSNHYIFEVDRTHVLQDHESDSTMFISVYIILYLLTMVVVISLMLIDRKSELY